MNIYNLKEKIIKQADNIYIHSYAKIIFIILVSTRWKWDSSLFGWRRKLFSRTPRSCILHGRIRKKLYIDYMQYNQKKKLGVKNTRQLLQQDKMLVYQIYINSTNRWLIHICMRRALMAHVNNSKLASSAISTIKMGAIATYTYTCSKNSSKFPNIPCIHLSLKQKPLKLKLLWRFLWDSVVMNYPNQFDPPDIAEF